MQTQWRAVVGKGKLDTDGVELDDIVDALRGFLVPPAQAVAAGWAAGDDLARRGAVAAVASG